MPKVEYSSPVDPVNHIRIWSVSPRTPTAGASAQSTPRLGNHSFAGHISGNTLGTSSTRRLANVPTFSLALSALVVACCLATGSAPAVADIPDQASLYGIKPGTELRDIRATYGEPSGSVPFDDGWLATVYQFDRHNLILETAPEDPEYIRSVQIEGETNPPGKGLLGKIDLGDSLDKAAAAFGDPLERKPAIDAITREPVPDTFLIRYTKASFEVVGSKITSIKSIFRARGEKANRANEIGRLIRVSTAPSAVLSYAPSS